MNIQSPTGSPRKAVERITNESEVDSLVKGFIKDLSFLEKKVLNKIQHGVHESEMRDKVKETRDNYAKLGKKIGKVAGSAVGAAAAGAVGVSSAGVTAAVGVVTGAVGAGVGVSMANESREGFENTVAKGVKGAIYGGSVGLVPASRYVGGEAGSAAGAGVGLVRSASKSLASNAGLRMNSYSMQLLEEFARKGDNIDCIRLYIQEHGQQYLEDSNLCVLT